MRTCKYCGNTFKPKSTKSTMCGKCRDKSSLLPRFIKARDEIRRKTGLLPLEQTTNDEKPITNVE